MALDYQKFLEARKKNFRDNTSAMASGLEALMTMGSGAVTEPLSGFAGLAGLPFGGVNQGVKNINAVADMGYQPRDPSALQMIGNAVAKPMEWLEGKKQQMGNATLKATDSPTLASLAYTSPEILGSIGALATMGRPAARAGRVAPTQESPDVVDSSRRDFMRNAGLLAAGAAVSRLPNMPTNLLDAPAVETAARAAPVAGSVARTVTRLNPDLWEAANWMRHNPKFMELVRDRGWGALADMEELSLVDRVRYGLSDVDVDGFRHDQPYIESDIDDGLFNAIDNLDDPSMRVEIDTGGTFFTTDRNPFDLLWEDPEYVFDLTEIDDFDQHVIAALYEGVSDKSIDPNKILSNTKEYFKETNKSVKHSTGKKPPKEFIDAQKRFLSKFSSDEELLGKTMNDGADYSRDYIHAFGQPTHLHSLYNLTGE